MSPSQCPAAQSDMPNQSHERILSDGTPYELHLCVEPGSPFTPQHLRQQLQQAVKHMSAQSRWQRFAAPVHKLSEQQLDHLTDLDGCDRLAWCAFTVGSRGSGGIGLARYVRLAHPGNVAEFAITVLDGFQGQGVGRTLLDQLIRSAREHGIATLRGYLTPGNRRMLRLCRHYQATVSHEGGTVRADIATAPRTG